MKRIDTKNAKKVYMNKNAKHVFGLLSLEKTNADDTVYLRMDIVDEEIKKAVSKALLEVQTFITERE